MRRVFRIALPSQTADELARRQRRVDSAVAKNELDVERDWRQGRKAKGFQPVHATLRRMAGSRERCMYCVDSHACDVDHFWPKADYPCRMARFDASTNQYAAKGVATVECLQLDQREAMTEGYRRTFRRLSAIVAGAIQGGHVTTHALLSDLREADEHGLIGWCFSDRGRTVSPVCRAVRPSPHGVGRVRCGAVAPAPPGTCRLPKGCRSATICRWLC